MTLVPRPGHVCEVDTLPPCMVCKRPASWDCPILGESGWANLCSGHQAEFGRYPGQTGVGIGQRLILPVPVPAPLTVGALLASRPRRMRHDNDYLESESDHEL